MFFDEVLAFDHVKKEILLIVTADLRRHKPQAAYADALRRLDRFEKRLAQPLPEAQHEEARRQAPPRLTARRRPRSSERVEQAKEYIAAGDIFQVVVSQRFDFEPGVDPFSVYRALRIVNPSPYMYFLRFPREEARAQSLRGNALEGRPPTSSAPRPSCSSASKAAASSTAPSPAPARAAQPKTPTSPPSTTCSTTRKNAPNT